MSNVGKWVAGKTPLLPKVVRSEALSFTLRS